MKFLYTLLFVFSISSFALSQRIATASTDSDFKTVKAGFVESVFTFNQPLSAVESADIIQWAKGNEPNIFISVSSDHNQLSLKVSQDYNMRAVYEKMFMQVNVEDIVALVNGNAISLSKEAFFEKFNF